MKRNLFLMFLLWLTVMATNAYSQCDPPSPTFTVASTDANCLGSGTVTASGVTGGTGVSYEYSLENPTEPGHAKPWQATGNFTEVFSGSYNVLVRSVCATASVYSTTVSQPITVGGNYQALYITATSTPIVSSCQRGTITATATNGYGTKQYALVSSLNVAEPSGATRQASNMFDGLAVGTYYVRVYDDCGTNSSYATTSVEVGGNALDNYFRPYVINTYVDCDNINLAVVLNDASNGFGAPGSSITLQFPQQTLTMPASAGVVTQFGLHTLTSLYNMSPSATWPQDVIVTYSDGCPTPATKVMTVQKPKPTLILTPVAVGCDTDPSIGVSVMFTQTQSPNQSCWDGFYSGCYGAVTDAKVEHVSYTTNGGTSWTVWDGNPVPITNPSTLQAKWCDPTGIPVQYAAPNNTLADRSCEINLYSCPGRTGFEYNQMLNGNPIGGTIHFTTVPPGQAAIPDATFTSTLYDYGHTPGLQNLLPGFYKYDVTVSTGCGSEVLHKSITLSHPFANTLTSSSPPTCNSNATVAFVLTEDNFKCENKSGNFGSRYVEEYVNGSWTGTTFVGEPSVTGMSFSLNNVPAGVHRYRVTGHGTNCDNLETTITIGNGTTLTLTQDLATNLCPGVGVVKMTAAGGTSFTFSLYQGAVDPANIIAGPQAGNSFSGLNPNLPYTVQTVNNCGTSVQSLVSFSNAPIPIFIEGATPCVGATIALKVYTFPGVTYQWYFDDGLGGGPQPLSGQTGATLTLASLTTANKGAYYATITYQTCSANSPTVNLDPANCAIPGSVRGTVYHDANAGNIDGTPTNVSGALWVDLMDGTTVVQSVPVQSDGTFFFPGVAAGSYTVVQRIATSTPGTPALPPSWFRTADGFNDPIGPGDGTADGIISFTLATGGEKKFLDFGINFSPLPVNLVAFKVSQEGSAAFISWSTASEENSNYFEVERSADAKKWKKVTTVPAKNNSNQNVPYSATDFKPMNGLNYYRLKMVDNDMTFGYSTIRSIEFSGKTVVGLYPNPVKDKLQIDSPDWENVSKVSIFNLSGKQVYASGTTPQSTVNVQSLASGMYVVKITYAGGATENLKIAIAR